MSFVGGKLNLKGDSVVKKKKKKSKKKDAGAAGAGASASADAAEQAPDKAVIPPPTSKHALAQQSVACSLDASLEVCHRATAHWHVLPRPMLASTTT